MLAKAAEIFEQEGPSPYPDDNFKYKDVARAIDEAIAQSPDNWKGRVGRIVKDLLCEIMIKGRVRSPQILSSYQSLRPWDARGGTLTLTIRGLEGSPSFRTVHFLVTPNLMDYTDESLFEVEHESGLWQRYFWMNDRLQALLFVRKITQYDLTGWVLSALQNCMPNEYVAPVQPGVDPWPIPPFSTEDPNIVPIKP